ncbi:hypothetical protein GOV14_02000 [Candidatus Pacearchaeota archaeon]|nr:hypothetical protein [Candidatus Pacearchaeota archaeon]
MITQQTLQETTQENPLVRYNVTAAQNIAELRGINDLATFIKGKFNEKVRVYALKDFEECKSGDVLLEVEGRVDDLRQIQPSYLEVLSNSMKTPINTTANLVAFYSPAKDKWVSFKDCQTTNYNTEMLGEII